MDKEKIKLVRDFVIEKAKKEAYMGSLSFNLGPMKVNVSFKDIERLFKSITDGREKEKKEEKRRRDLEEMEAKAFARAKQEEEQALARLKKESAPKIVVPTNVGEDIPVDVMDAEFEEEILLRQEDGTEVVRQRVRVESNDDDLSVKEI